MKLFVLLKVQGKERELVAKIGHQLGLDGTYIPRSYIEQVRNICIFSGLIILIHKYCSLMSPSEAWNATLLYRFVMPASSVTLIFGLFCCIGAV